MKILVTGATGFVGGRLLARLMENHEVWALARSPRGENQRTVHWLEQDLAADSWTVDLPRTIDVVIHLAQSPHFRDFPDRAADIHGVATGATIKLLEWARRAGARQFIVGSTGGLYGSSDNPVRETDVLPEVRSQLGFYFAAKRASELLAMQYASQFSIAIMRFFFVYGAGQARQMLMPRLVASIRDGAPVLLQGEEGIRINPIHVDDAVNVIARCLDLGESRIFNVAGPQVASLREVAGIIGGRVGRAPLFNIDNTVRPNNLVADIKRISSAFGTPKINLETGITELVGAGGTA